MLAQVLVDGRGFRAEAVAESFSNMETSSHLGGIFTSGRRLHICDALQLKAVTFADVCCVKMLLEGALLLPPVPHQLLRVTCGGSVLLIDRRRYFQLLFFLHSAGRSWRRFSESQSDPTDFVLQLQPFLQPVLPAASRFGVPAEIPLSSL